MAIKDFREYCESHNCLLTGGERPSHVWLAWQIAQKPSIIGVENHSIALPEVYIASRVCHKLRVRLDDVIFADNMVTLVEVKTGNHFGNFEQFPPSARYIMNRWQIPEVNLAYLWAGEDHFGVLLEQNLRREQLDSNFRARRIRLPENYQEIQNYSKKIMRERREDKENNLNR